MATKILIRVLLLMAHCSDVEKEHIKQLYDDPHITHLTLEADMYVIPDFHKLTIHISTSGEECEIIPFNSGLDTRQLAPFDPNNLSITEISRSIEWELDIWYYRPEIILHLRSISTELSFTDFNEE